MDNAQIPMKWHKCLIYFFLWLIPVSHIINAVMLFVYAVQNADTSTVYAAHPWIRTADLTKGVLLLGLAVFAVVTRFSLARFRPSGPLMLLSLLAVSGILNIGYILVASASMNTGRADTINNIISSLVATVLMVLIHRIYYRKRAALFAR